MLTLQSVQQVFLAHQAFPVYGRFGNAELKLTAEQGGQILSFRRTTFPVVHRSPCLGMLPNIWGFPRLVWLSDSVCRFARH